MGVKKECISKIIGAASGGTLFFKGILDDFALFNAPLSEDDIADIMNKGLAETLNIEFAASPKEKLTTTWASLKNH